MIFKEGTKLYAVEVERKSGENIMYINYLNAPLVPNIADNPEVMAQAVDSLIENPDVLRIIMVQQRNYSYSFESVSILLEIASLYNFLIKQENVLSNEKVFLYGPNFISEMSYLSDLLKKDSLMVYYEVLKRLKSLGGEEDARGALYRRFFEKFKMLLENLKIIKMIREKFEDYFKGDRSFYKSIFRAQVLPNFSFTRLVAKIPENSELIDQYVLKEGEEDIVISILRVKNEPKYFYHVSAPEYELNEEHHVLVNLARNVLIEHRPKSEEFTDPERIRQVFMNVAKDLLSELSKSKGIQINYNGLNKLAKILVRNTLGFGLIEVLLMDDKLQDIVLNAPIAQNPVFVRHADYEECFTNIIPSYEDADSWAAKLRLQSGRPLDEANPVLDSDIVFGEVRARVAAVKEPLSPRGLAYAFRRHRDKPWTLPLFIEKKMINSLAAGLLSFIIDGARTILVAGTRSAGKTSLLGSLMLEIMPNYRVIVVEDTLELPIDALRKIGYDILSMKVRSALLKGTSEIEASEGIRTSLRLGDSALIVGEVRSDEARALYEAMRIGALANVVAGTIHGDSPYGVFDRVVNDLGVPVTSFKATDLIVITNPIKTLDGLHSKRRVVQITEVRKHWEKDPLREKGFVDLMRYNVEKDELEPTPELINGDSEIIKSIASNVKGWAGNWDAVFDNIVLRARIKQEIVNASKKLNRPDIVESYYNALSNAMFHKISEEEREGDKMDTEKVFFKWKEWFYGVVGN